MKICTIVGARPQFIKAATVSRVIKATNGVSEVLIHTGQHYDANMSDLFFSELNIPTPHYNLNVGSGLHGKQTAEMLAAIEAVLMQEKPDWVLVYGDTNSTLAGSLAAVKLHMPVAHVEAGLRSFNRKMPEEINRIATDHLSDQLFAPTEIGYHQLLKEGICEDKVVNIGDVMYDATLFYNEYNNRRKTIVDTLGLQPKSFALVTIHRAENTDCKQRLNNICNALIELCHTQKVIFPMHPRTRAALIRENLIDELAAHVQLIDPVGYLDMLALEKNSKCIITDSGGVQKEAYFNQVPCITLRDETEWVELVECGWNRLCSPQSNFSLLDEINAVQNSAHRSHQTLYGNGDAAEKVVKYLC